MSVVREIAVITVVGKKKKIAPRMIVIVLTLLTANMTTVALHAPLLTFWRRNYFFILAHPVYKI